ncbi:MAG: hypothetical protein ACLR1G_06880 [Alistipes indistinctus]
MKRVAEIVRREQATVTVLSAMSGTTDALVQISKLAADGDLAAIGKVLDMLRDKYSTCIDGLLTATRQKRSTAWKRHGRQSWLQQPISSLTLRNVPLSHRGIADFGDLHAISG